MGYEIVYCSSCQSQIRGADLEKGSAVRVDGKAYCRACTKMFPKPVVPTAASRRPPPPAKRPSSDNHPSVSATPRSPRPAVATSAPLPFIVGGVAAGLALLILIGFALTRPGTPPAKAAAAPPAVAPPPPRPLPPPPAARPLPPTLLADLEKAAADPETDPTDLLMRCEEARKLLAGTPEASRVTAIEERALLRKRELERVRQLDGVFEQLRKIREEDPRFRRRADVLALLESAKKIAGSRLAEVQRAQEDYLKEADASLAEWGGLAAWYRFDAADALGKDVSGNERNASAALGRWLAQDGRRSGVLDLEGGGELTLPPHVREDFSILFWMKTKHAAPDHDLWFKGVGVVDAEMDGIVADFGVGLLGTKLAFGVGGPPDMTIRSTSSVTDGEWKHVAVTYNVGDGTLRIYVDGKREAEGRGPASARTAPDRIVVGRLQTGQGRFVGKLDDLRFYTRTLDDAAVASIAGK